VNALIARYRTELLFASLFSFVANLFVLASPLFMLQIYDRVLPSRSVPTLLVLVAITLLLLLAMAALETLRGRLLAALARRLDQDLGEPLAAALLRQAAQGQSGASPASQRDLATVTQFVSGPGLHVLFDAPWLPLFMGIIFLMHWSLGMLGIAGALLLLCIAWMNERGTREALEEANAAQGRATRYLESVARAGEAVAAMDMSTRAVARWRQLADRASRAQSRAGWIGGILSGLSKYSRYAVQTAMLGLGAWLVIGEHATPGIMIAATILLGRALAPVDLAVGTWRGFVEARIAFRRVAVALRAAPGSRELTELPTPRGALQVEGLELGVGRERPVLSGVSFSLAPGECLGVVGPSGAGKSTLMRALAGVLDARAGTIRLDGAELAAWAPAQRALHCGYLPQGVQLLPGTIADNIARLAPESDAAVVTAARRAFCHEMILSLPDAYDTEVGEAGERLPPGQRQRLALARAVFGQPRLVLLDEPNASLDGEGEQALIASLRAMRQAGVTVVVAGHKPSLMSLCDRLLVLGNGGMETIGPAAGLLPRLGARPSVRAVAAAAGKTDAADE
jgi:PrtD family type I secretion system ABC transporter